MQVRGALETLVSALTPINHAKGSSNEVQPDLMNTDLLSREEESIPLLLSLLVRISLPKSWDLISIISLKVSLTFRVMHINQGVSYSYFSFGYFDRKRMIFMYDIILCKYWPPFSLILDRGICLIPSMVVWFMKLLNHISWKHPIWLLLQVTGNYIDYPPWHNPANGHAYGSWGSRLSNNLKNFFKLNSWYPSCLL